ncbi:hypothetical protein FLACOL7796_03405 [Flavobacterium collinsii]|uniref:Uncharacterized protein n=1 Tax=Flavobacterium collinsii TaxID=1114861 RepID=A0ABN7EMM0_9FLAO|nr:hypothetical protein FLACOL7796_03405 [Flavobacterium collinsii]
MIIMKNDPKFIKNDPFCIVPKCLNVKITTHKILILITKNICFLILESINKLFEYHVIKVLVI